MALRDLAGDRVAITLIAPEPNFVYRPMKVAEPFSLGHARDYALADIAQRPRRPLHPRHRRRGGAREQGRPLRQRHARALRPSRHRHRREGRPGVPARAHVRGGPRRAGLHGLLTDLEQGYIQQPRLRRPARGDVDAAALRDRADDRPPGLEHGDRSGHVHARDARRAPAGDVRRPGQRDGQPPAVHRGHRVRRLVVPHRRARLRPRRSRAAGASTPTASSPCPASRGAGSRACPATTTGSSRSTPTDASRTRPASTQRATAPTSPSSRAASRPSRPTPWPRRSRPRPAPTSCPSRSARSSGACS